MTSLELPAATTGELAAVLEWKLDTISSAVDTLQQVGWVVTGASGRHVLVVSALSWLTDAAMTMAEPADSGTFAQFAGRYAAHAAASLDIDARGLDQVAQWVNQHRDTVIGAIRMATRAGLHTEAIALAVAAWRVADHVPDTSWRLELTTVGEDAARQAQDRNAFFMLLDRSAIVFADAGENETAADQWHRAANLADRWKDYDRTVHVLTALGQLYRRMGLLSQAADLYLELIDEHQREQDSSAAATAMIELGDTMLAGNEPQDATTYLSRADALLTATAATDAPMTVHARALELWGRALWQIGQSGSARRRWERALAMLVDHPAGETAADRVRTLLATPADQSLPADR